MKKIKLYMAIFFIVIMLIIVSRIIINTLCSEELVTVSGYAEKPNIKVTLTSQSNTYNTITDNNGYYSVNVKKDTYKVKFDYSFIASDFMAEDIFKEKSDLYNEKLELALIYNEKDQDKITQLEQTIKLVMVDNNNLRIIENSYNDEALVKNKIDLLEIDTTQEKAFHKIGIQGWKAITVIISNKSAEQLKEYLVKFSKDYKFITSQQSLYTSNNEIKNIIYTLLGIGDKTEESIFDKTSSTEVVACSQSINIVSNIVINLKLKQNTPKNPITFISDFNENYIEGNISVNNQILTNQIVKVTLINVNTNESAVQYTDNGYYAYGCPVEGTYKIKFEFATLDINGQYYEVEPTYTLIYNTDNGLDNSVNPENTNIKELKEKFATINYKEEEQLNTLPDCCKLDAYTDFFDVPEIEPDDETGEYDYEAIGKVYGGIRLQEREKFKLQLTEEISEFKLILSNNQVLADWSKEANTNVTNVATPRGGDTYIVTLDDELRHGASIYIEYKITVKNIGNVDCNGFSILTESDLIYDENMEFFSKNGKNSDEGWQIIDYDTIGDIVNKTDDAEIPQKIVYLKKEDSTGIKAGEEKNIYLVASKLLDDDCKYVSTSELIQYKNNEGRRNYNASNNIIIAGNYWEKGTIEKDTGRTETLLILPPFGKEINED